MESLLDVEELGLEPCAHDRIDGTANIREINKSLKWALPTDGPKTLSGLILENLESFPDANAGLAIGIYRLEILELAGNVVQAARVRVAAA